MTGAADAFTAFNEVASYVQVVKSDPHEVHRYKVVAIDGRVVSRGNHVGFVLDRAEYWENRYAAMVDTA